METNKKTEPATDEQIEIHKIATDTAVFDRDDIFALIARIEADGELIGKIRDWLCQTMPKETAIKFAGTCRLLEAIQHAFEAETARAGEESEAGWKQRERAEKAEERIAELEAALRTATYIYSDEFAQRDGWKTLCRMYEDQMRRAIIEGEVSDE